MFSKVKKISAILLVVLFLFQTAWAESFAKVNTSSLILRKSPSHEGSVVMGIPEGEQVTVIGLAGDWVQVRYGDKEGYVMRKYLILSDASSAQSGTAQSPKTIQLSPAKPGENNSNVKNLQIVLQSLGHYSGTLDGNYGKGTEQAVSAFQTAQGLTADGLAGEQTVSALLTAYNASSTGLGNAVSLYPGDNGAQVTALQQALNSLGYYKGSIDGNYGKATEEAVKRFQKNRKMSIDGIAGPGTLAALFGKQSASQQSTAKTPNSTPAVASALQSTASGVTYSKVKSLSEIHGVPTAVRPGDTSADVAKVQQALNVLGYYNGVIDGSYGSSTEKAVKAFQKNRGLSQDGIAGSGTIAALFNVQGKAVVQETQPTTGDTSANSGMANIFTIEDIGSTPRTSKLKDRGEDVLKLQQALALSNLYRGPFDGYYGEETANAVKAFQKKRSMNADGIAGPATIKYLFGSPAANADSYQSVVAKGKKDSADNVNLIESIDDIGATPNTSRPGDSGNDVVKLQQALSVLGYYSGNISGKYDDKTQAAVKKFQKKRSMNADGIAGASTIRVMFGEPAANQSHSSSSASTSHDDGMKGIDSIHDIGDPPNVMKPGSSGKDVTKLQQALTLLGYYGSSIDGQYGDSTTSAVKAFQKKRGMNADGIAGASTIRLIFGKSPKTADNTHASSKGKSVEPAEDPAMKGIKSISDIGSVPKTSKPGNYSGDVKKLQQALTVLGYYDDTIDSKYGETTKNAVARFQNKKGMNADGIAGASTIRLLFGKAASNTGNNNSSGSNHNDKPYKTEMINWTNSSSNNIIPKKAVFEIKDCRTGHVFKAKRWSGVNHIDAEPLTAADTKTARSVFGGFTWARRAILVKYNGRVYAASMNYMPHGTQTVTNNGFEGHFCIHFLNSSTHGSQKVDKDHQNMVQKAFKYQW